MLLTVVAIYYACPAVGREWQWIRPGAVFFTVGFAATSAAFSYYVGHFDSYDATYGSLGAVNVLMTWLYATAALPMIGAEITASLAHEVTPEAIRRRVEEEDLSLIHIRRCRRLERCRSRWSRHIQNNTTEEVQ